MTERISDGRLAEIWEWFCEWASQGPVEDHINELFQSLKAEREYAKQLEARVVELEGFNYALNLYAEGRDAGIEKAEAALSRVMELPEKWRSIKKQRRNYMHNFGSFPFLDINVEQCADELEVALIGEPK